MIQSTYDDNDKHTSSPLQLNVTSVCCHIGDRTAAPYRASRLQSAAYVQSDVTADLFPCAACCTGRHVIPADVHVQHSMDLVLLRNRERGARESGDSLG